MRNNGLEKKKFHANGLSSHAESKSPHANSSAMNLMRWDFKGIYAVQQTLVQTLGYSSRICILFSV